MSGAPIRMTDDPAVPAELRDALGRMAAEPPQPFDAVAGLARLQTAMQAAPPTAPSPSGAGASSLARLAVLGGGGAVVAGGIVAWVLVTRPTPLPAPVPEAPAATAEDSRIAPEHPSVPTVSVQDLPPVADEPPAPAASPRSLPGPAPTSAEELYREEIQHLANVRRLASANPSEALRLAQEGHSRFSRGMLYQEREAIAIGALARLGRRGEARSRAEQFLARFPRSPFADQVRRDGGLAAP